MNQRSPVEDQYNSYSYPEPGNDIETWQRSYNYNQYDPSIYGTTFWPEGRPKSRLNILVAGCGTMQAAVLAFNNPNCQFIGIDFSEASIRHEEMLRDRHRLKNLTLRHMNIMDVETIGEKFDLIISSGVLHHLPDPSSGLKSLAAVLDPTYGAMVLMLYGKFARSGVYALQDIFRRLKIPQSPIGVATVRKMIDRLSPRHPGRQYYESSFEMKFDAAIVDTFLHPQDVAYSVTDILELIEENGLFFQGWIDPLSYNDNIDGLNYSISDHDIWQINENINGAMTTHSFIVSHLERSEKTKISFSSNSWSEYYPTRSPFLEISPFNPLKIIRGKHEMTLTQQEMSFLMETDGRKSIKEILKTKRFAHTPRNDLSNIARSFYERMWRHGHCLVSKVPVKSIS